VSSVEGGVSGFALAVGLMTAIEGVVVLLNRLRPSAGSASPLSLVGH
jgi:hypothetical protein